MSLAFPAAVQDPVELLKRVKDRYGEHLDTITTDLTQSMASIIKDQYCYLNPSANKPIEGVNYQEDDGSIVFDMDNGETIFMKPVWIPTLVLDDKLHPDNKEKLKNTVYEKDKTIYHNNDWYLESLEKFQAKMRNEK